MYTYLGNIQGASSNDSRVIIVGKGGLGHEIEAFLTRCAPNIEVTLIDDTELLKYKKQATAQYKYVFGFADCRGKQSIFEKYATLNWGILDLSFNSTQHPIGRGSYIGPMTLINNNTKIGEAVTINFHCAVAHDCIIGDYTTISPNVHISGNVCVGKRVFIGTGTDLRNNIKICDDVVIGMGSVVVNNIMEPGTYFGNPCKKIKP